MNYSHTASSKFTLITLRAILLVLAGLSLAVVGVVAQTRTTSASDSTTPAGLAAGASAGSYALSGFENVNIYNGNLSFHLPLVHVGGRGSAGYTMMLALNSKRWSVRHLQNTTSESWQPTSIRWDDIEAGYGPGKLRGRHSGFGQRNCSGVSTTIYETTLTTLSFIGPDGTEYDLRDQLSGGQRLAVPTPCPSSSPWTGALRGKTWVTADGSAATFMSDNDIYDRVDNTNSQRILNPSGYLLLRDGTRYRIDSGSVSWIRDRNGNQVTFGGSAFATDSLGREVNVTTINPYTETSEDQIEFSGFGGAPRTIRVTHDTLDHVLRSGYSPQTLYQLFPQLNGTFGSTGNYNPSLVSSVVLPDGRSYQFRYNSYGELARVELPTGGAIEYDMASGSGVIQGNNGQGDVYEIYRRVAERRTYADGSTLESRVVYTPATGGSSVVTVNSYDANGVMLASEKHYFTGNPIESLFQELDSYGSPVNTYPAWNEGKEFKAESYDTNGTSATGVLRSLETAWQPGATVGGFSVNPQVASTTTTIADVSPNLVTKQTFGYDQYNNRTEVREYDFGAGVAPAYPIRHTHTDYLTAGYDVVNSTAASTIHIRELPTAQTVYAVNPSTGAETQAAQTTMSYDDLDHAVVNYGPITGWSDPGTLLRGNLTKTSHWLNSPASTLVTQAWYDQCGSVTSAQDAKGNQSQVAYSSAFAYGFPTATTSVVPDSSGQHGATSAFTSATAYDLSTGQVTSTTDANGVTTTIGYGDLLDRPTQVTRAANQGTSVKSQTTFNYDDYNHTITTTTDQIALADNILKSKAIYDGFGRTIESRQYETSTAYVTVKTKYDAFGRAFQSSNPYRSGENVLWTTSAFDAIGRIVTVTTPDSAVVSTNYSGNTVTVTDQNSKARKSVTDGLGRLTNVSEDPSGLNYLTSYSYDGLDNLITVNQGAQTRTFVYDSLKRLTSASNPESGTVTYQYDSNGNLTQKTDARGVVSTYAYDALNRNTSVSYTNDPASTPTVNRYYDGWRGGAIASPTIPNALGRVWQTETAGGTGSRTTINGFDALGRPTSESQQFYASSAWSQAYTTQRGYNLAGAVTSETYPSGRSVTYAYDSAGRATTFSGNLGDGQQKTYASEIIYSPFGAMTKEKFGTDTAIYNKLFYNSRGQLAELRESTIWSGPTDTTWDRGAIINYYSNNCWGMCGGNDSTTAMTDNNGNLKKQEVFIPGAGSWLQQYDYDSLNRLQRVHETTGNTALDWQQEYVYDAFGNRTIHQTNTYGTGVNKKDFAVNTANNRLGVPSGQSGTMSYDNAGNLTTDTYSGAAVLRAYDAENRMTKETQANSVVAGDYTYNADGQRVRRKVGSVETWQVYGMDGELLAEYVGNSSAASPQKEYGYRNGQLLITAEAAASASGGNAQSVIWTNAVGVSVSGGNLTKTAATGWGNAGAASTQSITSGDGYVETTASETSTARTFGLSHADADQNYTSIDFGIDLDMGGTIYVFESGNNRGTFGTYVTGDKLRVEVEGGVVKYKKNGTVFYASTVAPTYPLLVDTSLYSNGATLNSVVVGGSSTSWTNAVGVSAAGNDLSKTAATGWGNAGASSAQTITSGDGYVETTASETSTARIVGLSHADADQNYASIDFGIDLDMGGTIYVFESGNNRGAFGTYTTGDKLLVAVESGVVKYKKNGTVFYTSTVTPTYPLLVDTSLYSNGSTLTNVVISGGSSGGSDSSANINWLVSDQLGTPRMVFDQSGSLATTKRHDYAPFGEELFNGARTTAMGYAAADSTRQKFTSKERDNETGLDYFLARYYSPTQGRFTSPDEFSGGPDELYSFTGDASDNPTFYANLSNPQSLNKYQYAYNNPPRFIDPDGHDPLEPQDPVTAVVVVTKTVAALEVGAVAVKVGVAAAAAATVEAVKIATEATIDAYKTAGTETARAIDNTVRGTKRAFEGTDKVPKDQRAKPPGRKTRQEVYDENRTKNGGVLKCDECGVEMEPSRKDKKGVTPKTNSATLDHIRPRSRGGSSDKDNLRGACRKCNRAKSDND